MSSDYDRAQEEREISEARDIWNQSDNPVDLPVYTPDPVGGSDD